jgi:hypothetical protein
MEKLNITGARLIGTRKRTSNSYGRNLPYMSYRVILIIQSRAEMTAIENVYSKEELKELSYWSSRSDTMAMTCWGTSQLFEAQLALARFLGQGQHKGEEWGDFTRRATDFVKEI